MVRGNLAALDVLVLCDQAVEDWLKARLKLVALVDASFPTLLDRGSAARLITRLEAVRLQKLHHARARARDRSADQSRAGSGSHPGVLHPACREDIGKEQRNGGVVWFQLSSPSLPV